MLKPIVKLGPGFDLAFSPEGRYLATMPSTSPARLFLTSDWTQVATLNGLKHPRYVAFFHDASAAVVASDSAQVATFSIPDGKLLRRWRTPHGEFGAMTVTPDRERLVVSDFNSLHFYSLETGNKTDQMLIGDDEHHPHGRVYDGAFSRNGKYLAILWSYHDFDGHHIRFTVRAWPSKRVLREFNVDPGSRECNLETSGKATSICTSAGGDGISGARDIDEWCLANGRSRKPYSLRLPRKLDHFNFRFSSCGKRLIVMHNGTTIVYTSDGKTQVARLEIPGASQVFDAGLTADLKFLVTGTGVVDVWRLEDLGGAA